MVGVVKDLGDIVYGLWLVGWRDVSEVDYGIFETECRGFSYGFLNHEEHEVH